MAFSKYLESKKADCKSLVERLGKRFAYVSILGTDIRSKRIRVDRSTSDVGEGSDTERGFVVKMNNGRQFYEYSLCHYGCSDKGRAYGKVFCKGKRFR